MLPPGCVKVHISEQGLNLLGVCTLHKWNGKHLKCYQHVVTYVQITFNKQMVNVGETTDIINLVSVSMIWNDPSLHALNTCNLLQDCHESADYIKYHLFSPGTVPSLRKLIQRNVEIQHIISVGTHGMALLFPQFSVENYQKICKDFPYLFTASPIMSFKI